MPKITKMFMRFKCYILPHEKAQSNPSMVHFYQHFILTPKS